MNFLYQGCLQNMASSLHEAIGKENWKDGRAGWLFICPSAHPSRQAVTTFIKCLLLTVPWVTASVSALSHYSRHWGYTENQTDMVLPSLTFVLPRTNLRQPLFCTHRPPSTVPLDSEIQHHLIGFTIIVRLELSERVFSTWILTRFCTSINLAISLSWGA